MPLKVNQPIDVMLAMMKPSYSVTALLFCKELFCGPCGFLMHYLCFICSRKGKNIRRIAAAVNAEISPNLEALRQNLVTEYDDTIIKSQIAAVRRIIDAAHLKVQQQMSVIAASEEDQEALLVTDSERENGLQYTLNSYNENLTKLGATDEQLDLVDQQQEFNPSYGGVGYTERTTMPPP